MVGDSTVGVSGRNVLCLRMDRQVRKVLPGMEDMDLVDLVDLHSPHNIRSSRWQDL